MELIKNGHLNALPPLSYNGVFTMFVTGRNYGKTWLFKKRAFIRALKHGKKTLWLRTFKDDVKLAVNEFYSSKDLQKFCGIEFYDPETKKGNLKQVGSTFYVKKGGKWVWFLKVARVGNANSLRGFDDIDIDTIVYDEFTTTPTQEKRYHGNRVNDFLDIFISIKRKHKVRCIFLGNKENVLNPFLNYFGIKDIPDNFEGVKRFKNGSLIYCQVNNKPEEQNEYDKQVKDLFSGTSYGSYLYDNTYKNQTTFKARKTPPNSSVYIQLNINNYELKISVLNGFFYVNNTIDKTKRVFTLEIMNKYQNEQLLVKRQKQLFNAFINAITSHNVYYNSYATMQAIQPFYNWLGV